MNKPDYRIRIEIYDDQVGEVVTWTDTFLASVDDDNIPTLYRTLRHFKQNVLSHEADNYPKESEYEVEE